MRRVGRRVERVEGDVAGAAGGADQEGRLDRGIGQLRDAAIGFDAGGRRLGRIEAGPAGIAAIQRLPLGGIETRVRELAQAERAGVRKLIAVIGDSSNLGSVGVHKSCGFQHVGILANCGWKFDRWLDVVMMDRAIGAGCHTDPVKKSGD